MNRKSIILLVALFVANMVAAQDRALPFLELNPDVRTLSMGGAYMGQANQGYLYTNPTSMFGVDSKWSGTYSLGILPMADQQTQYFHAVNLGAKFHGNHVLTAGFRYLGGLEMQQTDEYGTHQPFYPKDFAIDLGYALQINRHFSAFLTGGYVRSYIGRSADAAIFGAGAYYNNEVRTLPMEYSIGLEVRNLGPKFSYGKDGSLNHLPTSIALGGNSLYRFNDHHKLNVALMGLYYTQPSLSQQFETRLGLEYTALDHYSLRTGYNFRGDNSYFSVGLGYKRSCFGLNVGYTVNRFQNNYFAVGINFN